MNSVDRVKTICKKRKIPISALERDLGYANGYIGQLRKGVFPDDRLVKIAEYLGVSVDYLLGRDTKEEDPAAREGNEVLNTNSIVLHRDGKTQYRKLSKEEAELFERMLAALPSEENPRL